MWGTLSGSDLASTCNSISNKFLLFINTYLFKNFNLNRIYWNQVLLSWNWRHRLPSLFAHGRWITYLLLYRIPIGHSYHRDVCVLPYFANFIPHNVKTEPWNILVEEQHKGKDERSTSTHLCSCLPMSAERVAFKRRYAVNVGHIKLFSFNLNCPL